MIKATISRYQFTNINTIRLFNENDMICIFYINGNNFTKQTYKEYIYIKFDENHRIYVDSYEIYNENEIGEMALIETNSI